MAMLVSERTVLLVCGMLACGLAGAARGAEAGAVIFWASDPVRPGETTMAVGDLFGDAPAVEIARLPDGRPGEPQQKALEWPKRGEKVEALQANAQSVKFVVPRGFDPGLYAVRVTSRGGSAVRVLNRPQVWWAQGDGGTAASPGGWVCAFGKNLGWGAKDGLRKPVMRLEGAKAVSLTVETDGNAAQAVLPADLPEGAYRLFFHNGAGGRAGWSEPVALTVQKKAAWPQAVFNVTNFGAQADGVKDDTAAIQGALAAAETNGGGVVYLPRGRYALSDALNIPRRTVLRGEREEWVALTWPDLPKPPEALVQGTNLFGVEALTIYANHHKHVIAGALGDKPDSGDVFLRRVRVRADAYRGHPTEDEVDARFRESMKWSTGGGDTVRLGGRNIEITECDFYGTGRALYLSRVCGGLVASNRFFNGRWLRVDEPAVFNAPDLTTSLWVKPETLRGRRGLVVKRLAGGEAPFILTQNGAAIGFEATDVEHCWSFNFQSPAVLKEGAWTHVAAVARRGQGVTLYADGKAVAEKKNPADRIANDEPLILGREQWGGDPATTKTPGLYIGLMDDVRVWTRALTAEEIQAEFAAGTAGR